MRTLVWWLIWSEEPFPSRPGRLSFAGVFSGLVGLEEIFFHCGAVEFGGITGGRESARRRVRSGREERRRATFLEFFVHSPGYFGVGGGFGFFLAFRAVVFF